MKKDTLSAWIFGDLQDDEEHYLLEDISSNSRKNQFDLFLQKILNLLSKEKDSTKATIRWTPKVILGFQCAFGKLHFEVLLKMWKSFNQLLPSCTPDIQAVTLDLMMLFLRGAHLDDMPEKASITLHQLHHTTQEILTNILTQTMQSNDPDSEKLLIASLELLRLLGELLLLFSDNSYILRNFSTDPGLTYLAQNQNELTIDFAGKEYFDLSMIFSKLDVSLIEKLHLFLTSSSKHPALLSWVKLLFLKLRWLVVKCDRRLSRETALVSHAILPFIFELMQEIIINEGYMNDNEEDNKKKDKKIKLENKLNCKKNIKNPSTSNENSLLHCTNDDFSMLLWSTLIKNYHLLYEYASMHGLDTFHTIFSRLLIQMILSNQELIRSSTDIFFSDWMNTASTHIPALQPAICEQVLVSLSSLLEDSFPPLTSATKKKIKMASHKRPWQVLSRLASNNDDVDDDEMKDMIKGMMKDCRGEWEKMSEGDCDLRQHVLLKVLSNHIVPFSNSHEITKAVITALTLLSSSTTFTVHLLEHCLCIFHAVLSSSDSFEVLCRVTGVKDLCVWMTDLICLLDKDYPSKAEGFKRVLENVTSNCLKTQDGVLGVASFVDQLLKERSNRTSSSSAPSMGSSFQIIIMTSNVVDRKLGQSYVNPDCMKPLRDLKSKCSGEIETGLKWFQGYLKDMAGGGGSSGRSGGGSSCRSGGGNKNISIMASPKLCEEGIKEKSGKKKRKRKSSEKKEINIDSTVINDDITQYHAIMNTYISAMTTLLSDCTGVKRLSHQKNQVSDDDEEEDEEDEEENTSKNKQKLKLKKNSNNYDKSNGKAFQMDVLLASFADDIIVTALNVIEDVAVVKNLTLMQACREFIKVVYSRRTHVHKEGVKNTHTVFTHHTHITRAFKTILNLAAYQYKEMYGGDGGGDDDDIYNKYSACQYGTEVEDNIEFCKNSKTTNSSILTYNTITTNNTTTTNNPTFYTKSMKASWRESIGVVGMLWGRMRDAGVMEEALEELFVAMDVPARRDWSLITCYLRSWQHFINNHSNHRDNKKSRDGSDHDNKNKDKLIKEDAKENKENDDDEGGDGVDIEGDDDDAEAMESYTDRLIYFSSQHMITSMQFLNHHSPPSATIHAILDLLTTFLLLGNTHHPMSTQEISLLLHFTTSLNLQTYPSNHHHPNNNLSLDIQSNYFGTVLDNQQLDNNHDHRHSTDLNNFLTTFKAYYNVLNALLIKRASAISNIVPVFIFALKNLLQAVMWAGQQQQHSTINQKVQQKLESCGLLVTRLASLMSEQHRVLFRKCFHYPVSHFVQALTSITLLPVVKRALLQGVYRWLDLCDEHTTAQLHAAMPTAAKEIFKSIYSDYQRYHKFKGK